MENATPGEAATSTLHRPVISLIASAAAFVVFLDATIVNVAFGSIEQSFSAASRADVALTLSAYAAVLGALLLPAGRFGDYVGHRRLFLISFAMFVAASALCGLAVSLEMLIAARVLQGAAAACLAPSSLALLFPLFRTDQKAYVVGIWSSAAAVATVLGPALGGLAVEALGWRSIFLVNVPIGAIVVAVGAHLLPTDHPQGLRPDVVAAAFAAIGAGTLTVALFSVATGGWGSPIPWAFLASALTCALLCAARGHATGNPLADPSLVGSSTLRHANIATFLTSAAGFALMFGNMLFLTVIWRYSALRLGLAVSPGPVMTVLASVPAGRLADRFGVRAVAVPGALLLAAGGTWFALRTTTDPNWIAIWLPGSIMTGIGIGLSFPAIAASAIAPAGADTIGMAVAVNGAVRQIGAVAGVTLVISLLRDASPAAVPGILRCSWMVVAALAAGGAVVMLRLRAQSPDARDLRRISRHL